MSPELRNKKLSKEDNKIDLLISNIFSFGIIILKSINIIDDKNIINWNSEDNWELINNELHKTENLDNFEAALSILLLFVINDRNLNEIDKLI